MAIAHFGTVLSIILHLSGSSSVVPFSSLYCLRLRPYLNFVHWLCSTARLFSIYCHVKEIISPWMRIFARVRESQTFHSNLVNSIGRRNFTFSACLGVAITHCSVISRNQSQHGLFHLVYCMWLTQLILLWVFIWFGSSCSSVRLSSFPIDQIRVSFRLSLHCIHSIKNSSSLCPLHHLNLQFAVIANLWAWIESKYLFGYFVIIQEEFQISTVVHNSKYSKCSFIPDSFWGDILWFTIVPWIETCFGGKKLAGSHNSSMLFSLDLALQGLSIYRNLLCCILGFYWICRWRFCLPHFYHCFEISINRLNPTFYRLAWYLEVIVFWIVRLYSLYLLHFDHIQLNSEELHPYILVAPASCSFFP